MPHEKHQRTLPYRHRPFEQPHHGAPPRRRTVPRTPSRSGGVPRDALRKPRRDGPRPHDRPCHYRHAAADRPRRHRVAGTRVPSLPSQRNAFPGARHRRHPHRHMDGLQHRRRRAGRRGRTAAAGGGDLRNEHARRNPRLVPPHGPHLLGICRGVRVGRHLGLPGRNLAGDARKRRAGARPRRRPARSAAPHAPRRDLSRARFGLQAEPSIARVWSSPTHWP